MPSALVHAVYFTLHDGSAANIARLTAACGDLLAGHPGELFFAAGPLVAELDRPVNMRDFHVGLMVAFASRKAHDDYQVSPRHQRFIAEHKASWASVRVFDSWSG
ncbi:MAG: Dabb family protein [Planctomycetes bacterium]|nr:Dabb family protein [Planctomycetota bacterium]